VPVEAAGREQTVSTLEDGPESGPIAEQGRMQL
jgi:hypothetical protein